MSLRTLYLQHLLSINGRDALAGRILYDHFRDISEDALLGYQVVTNSQEASRTIPEVKDDMVSLELFRQLKPNLVYVEGGLFSSGSDKWRFPQALARTFCNEGGILIVADVDHNEARQRKELYTKAANFLGGAIQYDGDSSEPVYAVDETRFWQGPRQIICKPEKMVLSDWLRPLYKHIPEILVGIPVELAGWGSIIASCNQDTTGTLAQDVWIDKHDACPFASVAQRGNGFVVLIAGNVSGDSWSRACQYNTRWLSTLATFLLEHAQTERQRKASHLRSPHLLFLSHRSVDKEIVSEISKFIKKRGVGVWIDEDRLIASQSLVKEIDRALSAMTHFVLFWSASCLNSPWVERELSAAVALLIEKTIPLIIVRLDLTPVPTIVRDLLRVEAFGQDYSQIGAQIVSTVERLGAV